MSEGKGQKRITGKIAQAAQRALLVDYDAGEQALEAVRIDGVVYQCAVFDNFTLREQSQLRALFARIESLEKKAEEDLDSLTEEDDQLYDGAMRRIAAMIVPSAPAATLEQLPQGQLKALAEAFFRRALEGRQRQNGHQRDTGNPGLST